MKPHIVSTSHSYSSSVILRHAPLALSNRSQSIFLCASTLRHSSKTEKRHPRNPSLNALEGILAQIDPRHQISVICIQSAFSCLTSLSSSSSSSSFFLFPTTPQPWSTTTPLHLLESAQHGPIYKASVAPSSAQYFESTILSITARNHGHLARSRCLHKIVQRASPACAWEVRISHAYHYILAETDGAYNDIEVIREKVQDGVTGETREMQYTQCKIVGNGSFGVVFQTKLAPNGEDAAIKRVLQDKRFKVSIGNQVMILYSRC